MLVALIQSCDISAHCLQSAADLASTVKDNCRTVVVTLGYESSAATFRSIYRTLNVNCDADASLTLL